MSRISPRGAVGFLERAHEAREFANSEGLLYQSAFEVGTDCGKYESLEWQSYVDIEEYSADLWPG